MKTNGKFLIITETELKVNKCNKQSYPVLDKMSKPGGGNFVPFLSPEGILPHHGRKTIPHFLGKPCSKNIEGTNLSPLIFKLFSTFLTHGGRKTQTFQQNRTTGQEPRGQIRGQTEFPVFNARWPENRKVGTNLSYFFPILYTREIKKKKCI